MLRKIRISLAVVCFVLINLLLVGLNWGVSQHIAWMARIQFLPALLALDYTMLLVLIVLTLLFGRIYCSIVCPLGVMQDLFAWLGRTRKRNRYSYSPEKRWLRYTVLAVFVVCLIAGFAPVVTLLEPYSAYGRIVNIANSVAFRSIVTAVAALLTLVIPAWLAWRNGRTYCNTVCPVGTILSFFARFSLMRVQVDETKCNKCSLCARNCKAAAIDSKSGKVDYSRCVACGDCLDKCKHDALHYRPVVHGFLSHRDGSSDSDASGTVDTSRRAMLTGAGLVVASAALAQAQIKVDGGLAAIEDKQVPRRGTPVTPPGSVSAHHMARHCTACQLCVATCPNNVLRPSSDPLHLMQPTMSFERGYCRPECTRCSQVCPTGAIRPVTKEEKTSIQIGHAVWIEQNCIPISKGDSCTACSRHCPSGAIQMVEHTTSDGRLVRVPAIDNERCIGCGECEYLCPARPFSAIYVEGNSMHHIN